MGQIGETISGLCGITSGLCQGLAGDIDAAQFARFAPGEGGRVNANHPAFAIGHLSIYPARVLEMTGGDASKAAVPESWNEMFKHGAECVDDSDGTVYPSKDEIMAAFARGHQAMIEHLPSVDDAVFAKEMPDEGMRSRFPTIGSAANFLASGHAMFHLGQVSTWRRCIGLGSVM